MSVAVVNRSELAAKAREAPVARLTLIGAVATAIGGIVFVMGLLGFFLLFWQSILNTSPHHD